MNKLQKPVIQYSVYSWKDYIVHLKICQQGIAQVKCFHHTKSKEKKITRKQKPEVGSQELAVVLWMYL